MGNKYIVAIICVIAAFVIAIAFVLPKYQEMVVSSRLVDEGNAEFDAQNNLLVSIGKIGDRYKKIEEGMMRISDLLPLYNAQSIPDLFVELEGLAGQSGLFIETISFSEKGISSSPKQAQSEEEGAQENEGKPSVIVSVQLSAKARYADLKRFAQAIETNKHLMDIVSFNIVPLSEEAKEDGKNEEKREGNGIQASVPDLFSYSISLDAYYQ